MSQPTTTWWWIRHAPVVGHNGKIYGQGDVDCDVSDAAAFAALAAKLPRNAVWATSHLKRAILTADTLLDAADLAPRHRIVEPDFAEQHFGDWQFRWTWDELIANGAPECREFWKDPANNAPPGGESQADVLTRGGKAIGRLLASHGGGDIVAVAHAGTIRAALATALGANATQMLGFRLANLSLTKIVHFEGDPLNAWRVDAVNLPPDARRSA
jgi:broad specificity phosphatase PhoE